MSFADEFGMENSETIISGIIVPAEWGEVGNVTGIALVTFDEDTFSIADSRKARTLMNFLRKTATLSGKVSGHGAHKKIHITQFQILESGQAV
jgi:hypothetical protein